MYWVFCECCGIEELDCLWNWGLPSVLEKQMFQRCATFRLTCCPNFLRSLKSSYLMQIGVWMLEAGCGYPVVPSFSSFFTATVQWVLAEELTQMEITSGNSQSRILSNSLTLSTSSIFKMDCFLFLQRRYLPVLRGFPAKYIYDPWNAPESVQKAAKCVIGVNYPKPMVNHAEASRLNIERMKQIYQQLSRYRGLGMVIGCWLYLFVNVSRLLAFNDFIP